MEAWTWPWSAWAGRRASPRRCGACARADGPSWWGWGRSLSPCRRRPASPGGSTPSWAPSAAPAPIWTPWWSWCARAGWTSAAPLAPGCRWRRPTGPWRCWSAERATRYESCYSPRRRSRMAKQPRRRSVGEFMKSGDWSDYWATSISRAEAGRIWVRGYPLEEIVEKLSYAEATWLLLRGELPTKQQAAIWELTLKIAMDQQFISSAACAARFVASAHPESPIPGVAAGILAHGSVTGSPRPAAEMIYRAHDLMQRERLTRDEAASRIVEEYLREQGTVPGFGHPIHKDTEPRADILRRKVKELDGWGEKAQLFEAIHAALCGRLGRALPINLAGMVAAVYCELGLDPIEIEALAAVGYGYAIVAHVVE